MPSMRLKSSRGKARLFCSYVEKVVYDETKKIKVSNSLQMVTLMNRISLCAGFLVNIVRILQSVRCD
jgi:hypothetical protein